MQPRVLVVDDDLEMTDMLKMILEPSFEVFAANNGADGIELMKSLSPDVLILDLQMPGIDGWQVCKEVRRFSQAPILVLSALSKPGLAARALDMGADDYLLKPMNNSVLTAHLRKLARRARAEKADVQNKLTYSL